MKTLNNIISKSIWNVAVTAAIMLSGCAATGGDEKLTLNGGEETPPVTTSASGIAVITIGADKSVSGTVTTTGIVGTAAHIHIGARGVYGPVIVPMTKTAENAWSFAPGAKLTDEQYNAYKAGNLFVNVHSATHKLGEIRAQLKPPADRGMGY